jgi:hypothetical protein
MTFTQQPVGDFSSAGRKAKDVPLARVTKSSAYINTSSTRSLMLVQEYVAYVAKNSILYGLIFGAKEKHRFNVISDVVLSPKRSAEEAVYRNEN